MYNCELKKIGAVGADILELLVSVRKFTLLKNRDEKSLTVDAIRLIEKSETLFFTRFCLELL